MTRAELCLMAASRQTPRAELAERARRTIARMPDHDLLAARDECRCSRFVVRLIEDEMSGRLGGLTDGDAADVA